MTTELTEHKSPSESKPRTKPSNAQVTKERTIRFEICADSVGVLTFDRPGTAANIFDDRTLNELAEELDSIERQDLKGLVLASAKKSIFIAGADLKSMSEDTPLREVRELIERGQAVMNRIARLPFATVAAIHGAAVGGGYEIALACDYRIASPDKATKIGLPETMIGLIPAWGGCTRLPRLVGLFKALDVILGGKTVAAKHALKLGMVDDVVPVEYLLEAALRKTRCAKPAPRSHWMTNNAAVASLTAMRVRKQIMKRTRGNYPAVLRALEVVTRGIARTPAESMAFERDGMLELVRSPATHNLIRIFFLQERAKKLSLPTAVSAAEKKPVQRAAVIGAGVMGSGMAQWISSRQVPVVLRDINPEQVAKGMANIAKLYQQGVKRRVFTPVEARAGLDRVAPTAMEVPLHRADVVIEAAVEKLDLKKKIFERLDTLVSDDCILATNTSALPISEIAAITKLPERVVGLHFFNPIHRMQLVEVIATRQTSSEVLERAVRFTQQIGKLPVVVKDSPGFVVNRILMPYLIEAGNLFEAGASVTNLDEAMLDFGMPMGPMRLLDEVGLDVSLHVAETLAGSFGNRLKIPSCLPKMVDAGLLGRKSGRGYYFHGKSRNPSVNIDAARFATGQAAFTLARQALQDRMVLLMVNEAARCLEEAVVSEPADVDFAMIMGTGFAPFRGGPLRHTDAIGATRLVEAMNHLVASGAAHFSPCKLLAEMAAGGGKFYEKELTS